MKDLLNRDNVMITKHVIEKRLLIEEAPSVQNNLKELLLYLNKFYNAQR